MTFGISLDESGLHGEKKPVDLDIAQDRNSEAHQASPGQVAYLQSTYLGT